MGSHLNNLGRLLVDTDRLTEAERMFRTAIQADARNLGAGHPNLSAGLNNLADLLRQTNRYSEVDAVLRHAGALEVSETATNPRGIDWRLGIVADQHFDQGRYKEAETAYLDLLAKCRESLGRHPHTATILNSLAQLMDTAGRRSEAELLSRESLAIFEDCFGGSHPNVASQQSNLACLLTQPDQQDEAESLFRSAILILEKGDATSNHPRLAVALNGLAGVLRAKGRLAEAERVSRHHLEILLNSSKRNGAPHPFLARAFQNYAGVLTEMGKPKGEILSLLNELGQAVGMSFQALAQ